jgi:hypothetical protein
VTGAAQAWVQRRESDVPAALRQRMETLLGATSGATPPAGTASAGAVSVDSAASTGNAPVEAALLEAALEGFRRALTRSRERSSALDLLAADALLTCACAAAAERGAPALEVLTAEAVRSLTALTRSDS